MCEVQLARFLCAKYARVVEIYRPFGKIYGKNFMNEENVGKWWLFKEGSTQCA